MSVFVTLHTIKCTGKFQYPNPVVMISISMVFVLCVSGVTRYPDDRAENKVPIKVILYIQFISVDSLKLGFEVMSISRWGGAFIKDTQKEVENEWPRSQSCSTQNLWSFTRLGKWKIHEEFWMGISSMASIRWIINISPSSIIACLAGASELNIQCSNEISIQCWLFHMREKSSEILNRRLIIDQQGNPLLIFTIFQLLTVQGVPPNIFKNCKDQKM